MAWALCVVLLATPPVASGQPRSPAVFGGVAWGNAGADDSEMGNIAMFGGEVLVPIRETLWIGFDAETGRIDKTHFGTEFLETSLTISALREWPRNGRVRGLAGGGVGYMFQRSRGGRNVVQADGKSEPFRSFGAGVLHGRGGLASSIGDHFRIRTEAVLWFGMGPTWLMGARASLGYEF